MRHLSISQEVCVTGKSAISVRPDQELDVTVAWDVSHKRAEKNFFEMSGKFTVLEIWK